MGGRVDGAEPARALVGEQQPPGAVDGHVRHARQGRRRGRPAVPDPVGGCPAPGDGGDGVVRRARHLTHPEVAGVGDEQVALPVDPDAGRKVERGRGGRAPVTHPVGRAATAGDGGDGVGGGVDAPHPVVALVGDEHVAGRVGRHGDGVRQAGLDGGKAVADPVAGMAAAGDGDRPGRVDLAHDVVAGVGDHHGAGGGC